MTTEDEMFYALMQRIGDDWTMLTQQLTGNRLERIELRISDYRAAHNDLWPHIVEGVEAIQISDLSNEEKTKQSLTYMQGMPGIDRAFALDYLRYYITMDLGFSIVQKFAAKQIVGGFDEMEQRACQKALELALQGFHGLGGEQAKLLSRLFMRQANEMIQDASVELGYAEASNGRARS